MGGSDSIEVNDLVRYLRDLAQLRSRPIINVDRYDEVFWMADVPKEAGCLSSLRNELPNDSAAWMVIDRVDPLPPPQVPPTATEWFLGQPVHDFKRPLAPRPYVTEYVTEEVVGDDGELRTVSNAVKVTLDERPRERAVVTRYLARWTEWSQKRAEVAPRLDLYTRLFKMAELTQQMPEEYECVAAVGLVTAQTEKGAAKRHMLTAPAQITLDAKSGRIIVEPSEAESAELALEQDMVAPKDTPDATEQAAIRSELSGLTDPFALDETAPIVERWSNGAQHNSLFRPDAEAPKSTTSHMVVVLAPAIIVRKRSKMAILDTYDELLRAVEAGAEVPPAFFDLSITGDGRLTDEDRARAGISLDDEILFPLPANEEQRRIINLLRRNRGVVVHGPPGTGKSHTIANIISHAVASGQRVLVTSHSSRALEVLADKLPGDIRSLAVSMLGHGSRGTEDLERSANEILRRRQDPEWLPEAIVGRLDRLEAELVERRAQRKSLVKQLTALRASETETIDLGFGDYRGTRAELAQQLDDDFVAPSWMPDSVSGDAPITLAELEELRELARALSIEETRNPTPFDDLPTLPSAPELTALINDFVGKRAAHESSGVADAVLDQLESVSSADVAELATAVSTLSFERSALENRRLVWTDQAVDDIERGTTAVWTAIHTQTSAVVNQAASIAALDGVTVSVTSPVPLAGLIQQAIQVKAHLDTGGSLKRLVGRHQVAKDCEAFLTGVLVQGLSPDTPERCAQFLAWASATQLLDNAERAWPAGVLATSQTYTTRVATLTDALAALNAAGSFAAARATHKAVLSRLGLSAGLVPSEPSELDRAFHAVELRRQRRDAEQTLVAAHAHLRNASEIDGFGQLLSPLVSAVEQLDTAAVTSSWNTIERQMGRSVLVRRFHDLIERMAAGAPNAARAIIESHETNHLSDFHLAWDRQRASQWLDELERIDANGQIRKIRSLDDSIGETLANIASHRAWIATLERLTDAETQHLKGYQTAMRRRGKGNSKFDLKYRNEARQHLSQCYSAIPAWVMPAHQVAATMPRTPELFDVVIIDEASQSGVDELFLFWLGKQVIVVGDKQQISPEGNFDKQAVVDLQAKHLRDWSFKGEFGAENSLFDVAEVKYVAGEIWLTEHFRCMPEIIEYSNKLSYVDHPLRPVRQFGADRLPPLRRRKVEWLPEVEAEGDKINRGEAAAICDQIAEILEDPAYLRPDGTPMTIGVISLLGNQQTALISSELMERVGSKAWADRRIHVGDSADFQGDERDIIMLSMVVSPPEPGRRIAKLGLANIIRRYNVAASRAKDQLWLFHSVSYDELNPECPRARLIAHMDDPGLEPLAGYDGSVTDHELIRPFDSLFEQRLFLELTNRGYKVQPQWQVLGYRIDLVVVGPSSLLAIEADGDFWHGPDAYEKDLARQADLERVGWTFERVREWEFYCDRPTVIDRLLARLDELNIGPNGSYVRPPAPPAIRASDIALSEPTDWDDLDDEDSMPTPPPFAPPPWPPTPAVPFDSMTDSGEPPALIASIGTSDEDGDLPGDTVGLDDEAAPTQPPAAPTPIDRSSARHDAVDGLAPYKAAPLPVIASLNGLRGDDLVPEIVAIVDIEGPIVAERLLQLLNQAAGNARLGNRLRETLTERVLRAVSLGRVDLAETSDGGFLAAVVTRPGMDAIRVREIGPREFKHIPRSEVAARLAQVRTATGLSGADLYGVVHREYGFQRLRSASLEIYSEIDQLYGEN